LDELKKVIAIDGPSGSGKSTLARKLAQQLNLIYIDTGAMFRALAFYADKKNISFEENDQMKSFLAGLTMHYGRSEGELIVINSENLTQQIREHNVSKLASIISQIPSVRQFLLNFQRQLADEDFCVMEGRDIGTVVFPKAFCKFFVTASLEVRSERRLEQLKEQGQSVSLEQVTEDVLKRDESDINRTSAPLKQADDAIFLDTSGLDLDEVLEHLKDKVRTKAQALGYKL